MTDIDDFDVDRHVPITIGDKRINLKMRADDVTAFVVLAAKDDVDNDDVDRLTSSMKDAFYRTFPGARSDSRKRAKVDKLIMKYYMEIFKQVITELDWADESEVEGFE